MTKDDIELGCEKLVANFGTVNPQKITLIFERFRSIPVRVWNNAVAQILDNYEGSKFPSIATIRQYIESVTEGQLPEDTPEIAEMKRIDLEIRRMPEDDRRALLAIAKSRAEEEIEKYVGPLPDAVMVSNRLSPELFLSNEFVTKALLKMHCRQVWREMQRTEYGKTSGF
jgi:hypothetical protein